MSSSENQDLTIIAIGSSAGGLEAIRELVTALPTDLPVSYVVVQHMSPHHKSLMTELVARQTSLAVRDVVDGMVPERNVIHVTPPRTDILFEAGKLRLVDPSPEPASPKPSVDRFLTSLADEYGEKTVAIILSGTGSDGSYGIQAVREAGGITIAQDNESAKYDGMPHNAVQTGCIDLILPPADIGTHLQKILSSPRDFGEFRKKELLESPVSDLLQILLARTRVDFREYKQATINRRIERRMVALGIETQEEYTQFCRTNPSALDALFKDLLISVTRFFRDKDEFEELRQLLPQLVSSRNGAPLRVWIAGCATGEEAYSIAMLLSEALGGNEVQLKNHVQIFATDIDKDALQVARRGVYGLSALNEIPKDLADKYLIRQSDGVRVVDSLRNAILFSDHNVCQDPPFQKIDLLCCRNLLIYFGNPLQHKVMSRFHYSLASDGLLFLGTAESVAGADDMFTPERQASHIFRKRTLRGQNRNSYPGPRNTPVLSRRQVEQTKTEHSTERHLFEALASSLGDDSILVTEDYAIARVYGDISKYIEITASSSLRMHLDLLRSPLREEARSLVTIAMRNNAHRAGVRHLLGDGDETETRIDVYPIIAKDINENAALVVFSKLPVDHTRLSRQKKISEESGADSSERIQALESEIATTREALQQTIEELETSNEELQSLNEELQSTNEELQATNEELETSNEELQSTNEELITVNEELQVTAAELSGRTGELTSVIESTPLAVVVMDNALQISQATNAAANRFQIRRPISNPHISQCVLPEGYPSLAPICSEALKVGETVSSEFNSNDTRVLLTCSPYFNVHGQILGVTMVITEFPGLAREMELLLNNSKVYVTHQTIDGTILRISESAAKLLGKARDAALGLNLYDLLPEETATELRQVDRELLYNRKGSTRAVYRIPREDQPDLWLSEDKVIYQHPAQEDDSIYSVAVDVTEMMQARTEAEQLIKQLTLLQDMAHVGYWSVDLDGEKVHWSQEVYRIHGVDPSEAEPPLADAIDFYHPDDRADVSAAVEKAISDGGEFEFTKRIVQKDGTEVEVLSHGIAITDADGRVNRLIGVFKQL
ncbi:PAS domain-containing protein [Sulfitobacter albidus]|uniref:protein-glutamate O-methyltransferase n=1 Tax=Sulfitobacter albidus TaxID=2829501 RepID=A0A975PM36_9RHOB|nr:chemotaxis protein CheB [Sulfitobacter albidus]QUJ76397.1 PAS domain-containing protein [Sulfitobacter albidus]